MHFLIFTEETASVIFWIFFVILQIGKAYKISLGKIDIHSFQYISKNYISEKTCHMKSKAERNPKTALTMRNGFTEDVL
jgi:hypothetical protein